MLFSPEQIRTFRGAASQTFNSDNQRTGTDFAYDGDGNPTTYKGTALSFDVNDRLTAVGSTLTAGYGADGLRAWKTDSSGTSYYLYDGDSTDPVCEMNSSGTVVATNTFGVTGLISRNTSSGSTFYSFDQQGTAAERLNSVGSCTSSSTSDAFGVVANSGSVSDPYGYEAQAGYYTDQSTGLCLTTFRYYDPGAGRFLNRDPIGFDGGINLYAYCGNSSTTNTDPSGHSGGVLTLPGLRNGFGSTVGKVGKIGTTAGEAAGAAEGGVAVVDIPGDVIATGVDAVCELGQDAIKGHSNGVLSQVGTWLASKLISPGTHNSVYSSAPAAIFPVIMQIAGDGKQLRGTIKSLRPNWKPERIWRVADEIEKLKDGVGAGGAKNVTINKDGFITGPGGNDFGNIDDH